MQCRGHLGLADSEEADDTVSGCGILGLLHWNVAPGLRDELMKPCSGWDDHLAHVRHIAPW